MPRGRPAAPPKSHRGPLLALPEGDARPIEPDLLLLDPHNLRLLERAEPAFWNAPAKLVGQTALQSKILEVLASDEGFDVRSLATSILNNGFLRHELMIVAPYDASKFIVLEGNRRLAAVRTIFKENGPDLTGLPSNVRDTLKTLPCFVLSGDPIDGDEQKLTAFRRAAEIYIGMRHLMGAKSWEPASRYEFQANLILNEHWTPAQVAERFGRDKSVVLRDLKAQRLYRNFRAYEKKYSISHKLTYNAFAEAARAKSIMDWLGWSNDDLDVTSSDNQKVFFKYLISRVGAKIKTGGDDEDEVSAEQSSELVVRQLRDMLKLDDDIVTGALEDEDFDRAELMFQERREGAFTRRISSYVRGLQRVTSEELLQNPKQIRVALLDLVKEAQKIQKLLEGLLKK